MGGSQFAEDSGVPSRQRWEDSFTVSVNPNRFCLCLISAAFSTRGCLSIVDDPTFEHLKHVCHTADTNRVKRCCLGPHVGCKKGFRFV